MDRIWIGKNIDLSPKAYLLGPIIIGDHCVIEDHSHIIGPTSIGSGVRIEKGALVRDSILWNNMHLQNNALIEYSLVGEGCVIPKGERIKNTIVMQNKIHHSMIDFMRFSNNGCYRANVNKNVRLIPFIYEKFKYKAYLVTKRFLDILFACFGILTFLPTFIFIAVLIKLDSRCSIFFSQRCGKHGREFKMHKFRTMVTNAY